MKSARAIGGLSLTYLSLALSDVLVSRSKFGIATLLWHSIPAFCFMLYLSRAKGYTISFSKAKKVLPHALARIFGMSCLIIALLNVKVGIVNTIVACSVFVIVFVLAPLFGGEKPNSKILIPLCFAVLGVALIFDLASFDFDELKNKYLIFAFLAMVGTACGSFLWRECSKNIAPVEYLTYLYGLIMVLIIPVVVVVRLTKTIETDLKPSGLQFILLSIAWIAFMSSDLMFSVTQKYSTHILNGLFAPAGAVFGTLFGFLIKGETLSEIQLLGISIVVASVAFASTLKSTSTKKTPEVSDMPTLENPVLIVKKSRTKKK